MGRVIVSVKRAGEVRERDLELPDDLAVGQLAELIARSLHWDTTGSGQPICYHIKAEPQGRMLHTEETLLDASVWDGAWLTLEADQPMTPAVAEIAPALSIYAPLPNRTAGYVEEWTSLGIDVGSTIVVAPPEQNPNEIGDGFTWIKLDD